MSGRAAAFLALAFAGLAATNAAALEMSLPEIQIPAGATVEAAVKLLDAGGLAALQVNVKFDGAAFEVSGVRAGPALANAMIDFGAREGLCRIAVASLQPLEAGGDVLFVAFRRKNGATSGSTVELTDAQAWKADGAALTVATHPGAIAALGGHP